MNKNLVLRHRQYCRSLLRKLKEQPCSECGNSFPSIVMDFHHINPATKFKGVSQLATQGSLIRMLKEIEKCILLCANCHRLRTYEEKLGV